MSNEQAKSELMQIYGFLSEEKKQALDVLMEQTDGEYDGVYISYDLISRQAVIDAIYDMEILKYRIDLEKVIKELPSVAIPSAEPQDSENKIIRRTLENFMRGLWEEIQVGELEYTTSEVYEMLEREIFTDNHVAISPSEPKTKWIPVSERLPNRNEFIASNGLFIVSDGNRSYAEYFDMYNSQKYFGEPTMEGFKIDRCVTKWMPLPPCCHEPQESEDKE